MRNTPVVGVRPTPLSLSLTRLRKQTGGNFAPETAVATDSVHPNARIVGERTVLGGFPVLSVSFVNFVV